MNGIWCDKVGQCSIKSCVINKQGVFLDKQPLFLQRHADQQIFFPTVSINGTAIVALSFQKGELVQIILPEPLDQMLYYGGVFLCCGELVGDAWRLLPLSMDKWIQCVRSWRPFDEAMMAKVNEEGIKGAETIMSTLQNAMDGIGQDYKRRLDRKRYVGGIKRKHSEIHHDDDEEEEEEDEEEEEETNLEEEEDDKEEEEEEDDIEEVNHEEEEEYDEYDDDDEEEEDDEDQEESDLEDENFD